MPTPRRTIAFNHYLRRIDMHRALPTAIAALILASVPTATPAATSWELDARLRHESVSDDAFTRDADATTLRLRAALRRRLSDQWEALLQGEGVASLQDAYNSTANGNTVRPVVADPQSAEINQAWLAWRGADAGVTVGRQRLVLENQRWISNVGWRQNEQTFDAVAAQWTATPSMQWTYHWIDRVHRVNGDRARDRLLRERDLNTHVAHLAYSTAPHRFAAYAVLHEDRDVAAASTATYGARYVLASTAARPLGFVLDAARQEDHADNPASFGLDYWLVEASRRAGPATLRAGWEHLGSDGPRAVQAPLGLLHAFNGWADRFTSTPIAGLDDRYLSAGGPLPRGSAEWVVAWHDYRAARGSARYGSEWNASLAAPLGPSLKGLVKLAHYDAVAPSRDVAKFWLQIEWTAKGAR